MDSLKSLASSSKGFFDIVGSKIYRDVKLEPVDLSFKRVIVTGANSGIGKEIALQAAEWGAEVHLVCRDEKKANEARDDIVFRTGNNRIFTEHVELTSFLSIREFVRRWNQRKPDERTVDIFFSNAGLAYASKYHTKDGFEINYHVNTLSHYALIIPMLQLGLFAPDARIIILSSSGIYASKKLDPEDLNSEDILGPYKIDEITGFDILWTLSARSKAQQVVFARELQAKLEEVPRLKGITIQTCHPGAVNTEIYRRPTGLAYNPTMAKWSKGMIEAVGISAQQGATTPLFLATSPEAVKPEVRGKYWERCGWKWTPAWMEDAELRVALWKKWEEHTKIKAAFA